MAFGEIFLAGHGGQSRAGKIASSCPLGQPIIAQDLIHLARSRSQPYNKNSYYHNLRKQIKRYVPYFPKLQPVIAVCVWKRYLQERGVRFPGTYPQGILREKQRKSPVLHCASLLRIISRVISARAVENGGVFFTTGPRLLNPTVQKDNRGVLGASFRVEQFFFFLSAIPIWRTIPVT